MDRRTALAGAGACLAGPLLPATSGRGASAAEACCAGRVYKACKISMVQEKLSLADKLRLLADVGFEGVTLFAPDRQSVKEARHASDVSGLRIHNINDAIHWKTRLSDPDPQVREKALAGLKDAIRFAHAVGASSVLLVVGKVTDPKRENHQQVWDRSIAQVRKALPLAAKLGVHILAENVRNGFCAEPDQWARYLDAFGSPWVGSFFDIANHQKFAPSQQWVRTLDRRIVKLDVKDWNPQTDSYCKLGAGAVDWPAIRKALTDLRFTGWATAELPGGDRERLREVSQNMDRVLNL